MIKAYKPTTPSRRSKRFLVRDLDKVSPEKSLLSPLKGTVGRANGRVSTRHRQRGAKKNYRIIDFKRNKFGIIGRVATIEYDPNRGSNIALIHYSDGEKRYILAPQTLVRGAEVLSGPQSPIAVGNSLPLLNIPLGTRVHNIELNPGRGGQMARGAGNYAIVMARDDKYTSIKLPSSETKLVLSECYATIGELSGEEVRHTRLGKAGTKRHLGWRPEVRGVAMGAYAHPHGGSYRDNGIGMPTPKTPWGKKARGVLTRHRKRTDRTVVNRRIKKKK